MAHILLSRSLTAGALVVALSALGLPGATAAEELTTNESAVAINQAAPDVPQIGERTEPVKVGRDLVADTDAGGVAIPVSGDGAVTFDSPAGEFGVGLPALAGTENAEVASDGTVVFGTAESASLAVQTFDEGAKFLSVIASPDAPTEYVYPLEVPEGGSISLADDQTVIVVDVDGVPVAGSPAPWASDADGFAVPTRYELRGAELVQVIDHTTGSYKYPIVADPVWFIPVAIAGRMIIHVTVKAATNAAARAAAARIAAAQAAKMVVKSIAGRIASAAAKRCYKGAAIGAGASSVPATVQQMGDGTWKVRFSGNAAVATVSSSVGGCLAANIR